MLHIVIPQGVQCVSTHLVIVLRYLEYAVRGDQVLDDDVHDE